MATVGGRNDSNVAIFQIYIACVGASLLAVFADHARNNDTAALAKAAAFLREVFAISGGSTSGQRGIALLIFIAIACLLVMVYKPKETKESFLLGASVLVVAGLSTPPVQPAAAVKTGSGFFIIPSAYAQAPISASGERSIWLKIDGPKHYRMPETKVTIFSGSDGRVVFNSLVGSVSEINLPAGPNQVEISHNGFRAVSFRVDSENPLSAYQVRLEPVKFDSISNFLGPKEVAISEDKPLGAQLSQTISLCRQDRRQEGLSLLKNFGIDLGPGSKNTIGTICFPTKLSVD